MLGLGWLGAVVVACAPEVSDTGTFDAGGKGSGSGACAVGYWPWGDQCLTADQRYQVCMDDCDDRVADCDDTALYWKRACDAHALEDRNLGYSQCASQYGSDLGAYTACIATFDATYQLRLQTCDGLFQGDMATCDGMLSSCELECAQRYLWSKA